MAQIPSELLADRRHDAHATLNTRCQRGKREARRPVFRTDFGALDADIVALQETITDDTD